MIINKILKMEESFLELSIENISKLLKFLFHICLFKNCDLKFIKKHKNLNFYFPTSFIKEC